MSSSNKDRLQNLGLTLPFLLLYWVDLAHHQLWFDELNAWGLVVAAGSFQQLLGYVHFEGHPWFWYGVLYGPSRLTHDPVALKWVGGAFGTAIYLVIGLLAPFSRVQKVLLFLSYFVVFEYTVLSRMYGVMFLLALLYAWRRVRVPDGVVRNVALLAVMANTDATGVLLSGALLLEYSFERWQAYRRGGWSGGRREKVLGALAIYVGLLAVSVYTAMPSKAISWQASGHFGTESLTARKIVDCLGNVVAAPWWPISREFPHRFWATDALLQRGLLVLLPVVLVAYWRIFRRERNLQLLLGLTIGFAFLFADVIYEGRVRHWGITFVAFVVALWLRGDRVQWSGWVYGLMGLAALSGVAATAASWTHPFSQAGAAAAWIRTRESADVPLVSDWDITLVSVTEQLQRPIYFMECRCMDRFKLFSHERDQFPQRELPARTVVAMDDLHTTRVVLLTEAALPEERLTAMRAAGLRVSPLVEFTGADAQHQDFYLYSVER